MHATGRLRVDLDALARNYARVAAAAATSTCAAVVKADAYGLGMGPVAGRLHAEGCRDFFVANAAEGAELRSLLADDAIYVLEGVVDETLDVLIDATLVPVLNTVNQVERWSDTGRAAVLHIDTGMNRLGLSSDDVDRLASRPELLGNIDIAYTMTHLACADEPAHPLNRRQLERFDVLRARLPDAPTSIGNSAGAFLGPEYHGDLVRPGIALFGGNPFAHRPSPVESVATVEARVLQVRDIDEPATVGYGATFAAAHGARIAVIGIGYADGYPRLLGNCGAAYIGDTVVPVVGRVSMDLITLDVSALPAEAVAVGDYVELIGPHVLLDDVAEAVGTIGYEILTSLGARFERIYEGEVLSDG